MESRCPQILIEANKPGPILRQRQAQTKPSDEFRISNMLQDISDRPFTFSFRMRNLALRETPDRFVEQPRRSRQDIKGIPIA